MLDPFSLCNKISKNELIGSILQQKSKKITIYFQYSNFSITKIEFTCSNWNLLLQLTKINYSLNKTTKSSIIKNVDFSKINLLEHHLNSNITIMPKFSNFCQQSTFTTNKYPLLLHPTLLFFTFTSSNCFMFHRKNFILRFIFNNPMNKIIIFFQS